MRVVIWKQLKTSEKRFWGLRKLGAPVWMAKQSVGFGNHYQSVIKTTGLNKITKEIFTKRGLISGLDYYMKLYRGVPNGTLRGVRGSTS